MDGKILSLRKKLSINFHTRFLLLKSSLLQCILMTTTQRLCLFHDMENIYWQVRVKFWNEAKRMKCAHASRLWAPTKITLYKKKFPSRYTITAVMSHRLEVCFYLQLTVKSQSPLSFKLPFSFFLPSIKQKIICTLSPASTHTSNFPHLIQPSTPYTSVRYNWRGRGHAETSIKGS